MRYLPAFLTACLWVILSVAAPARAATRAHLRQVVARLERLGMERPELFA